MDDLIKQIKPHFDALGTPFAELAFQIGKLKPRS